MQKVQATKILEQSTTLSTPFLNFFWFITFSGASLRWEFKNTTKNVLQKKCVKKFLQTNRQQNLEPIFLDFCLSRFRAFLGEGNSKHEKQISKKSLINPGTFLASEEPTKHVGSVTFFLSAPWFLGKGSSKSPKTSRKKSTKKHKSRRKSKKKYKKMTSNPKPIFSRFRFIAFLGVSR
jgi:hypothetical protein